MIGWGPPGRRLRLLRLRRIGDWIAGTAIPWWIGQAQPILVESILLIAIALSGFAAVIAVGYGILLVGVWLEWYPWPHLL